MALAVPVTLKTTEEGENERLDYAVSAMQGHRENMEDAHAIVLNLDAATGTSFFGVYDGHGGPAVSKYCARHLHIELRRHERFRDNLQIAIERTFLRMDEMMKDRSAGRELSGYGGNDNWKAYRKAMRTSLFLPFCQKPAYPGPENDGCTACVVLIRGNQIIVGNAGDSRCVLSRNNLAIDLSNDFKPNLPAERQRIETAGHEVIFSERGNVHRIDDGIAISRSLGDLLYKDNNNLGPEQQAITAFPEVRTEEITQDDQFLIIACDGIWDCLTSQQAVDFIRIYLNADVGLAFICEALLGHCLAQPRGWDNMTVVLVRFKTPGSCQVRGRNALPRPINQAAAERAAAEQAAAAQAASERAAAEQAAAERAAADRTAAARVPPPPAIRAATSTSAPSTPSFPGAPPKSPESSKSSEL
ncbi:probable protein phosphatase 2C 42 [Miscanthus floridulus]|uniref:probable protein phosphatase 2C 42 n=1 Tax=Miscanthus floridulus TaxID=154761 RepID=UPI0034587DA5